MDGKRSRRDKWKRETYKIEVSSGSVSSGISSPTDTPRGRLLAPTAEVKNPIMVSVFGERGGGREWGDLKEAQDREDESCMKVVRKRRGRKAVRLVPVISQLCRYEYSR